LLDPLEVDHVDRVEAGISPAQLLTDFLGVSREQVDHVVAEARAVYDPGNKVSDLADRLPATADRGGLGRTHRADSRS